MKKIIALILMISSFISCKSKEEKTEFTAEVLNQKVKLSTGEETTLGEALSLHKGKETVVEVWASWCGDCIKSLPKVSEYQSNHSDLNFIFISVDNNEEDWKRGIENQMNKHNIEGTQIWMPGGWGRGKGSAFTDFIGLDWIPRYMLLDASGKIKNYYSKDIADLK